MFNRKLEFQSWEQLEPLEELYHNLWNDLTLLMNKEIYKDNMPRTVLKYANKIDSMLQNLESESCYLVAQVQSSTKEIHKPFTKQNTEKV